MSGENEDKIGPQSVPALNVRDVDANQNVRMDSSKTELKSGIITEGDSKSRQKSGRSQRSSGEYSMQIHKFKTMGVKLLHAR